MSGMEVNQIREKVRRILESMRGSWGVWSLKLEEVSRRDSTFVVVGRFTPAYLSTNWIAFTVTIDQRGNVLEARIG